jgi:hypothetical protein
VRASRRRLSLKEEDVNGRAITPIVTLFLALALAFLPTGAQGQSLAELAKKEKERRAGIQDKAPVITDRDLGPGRIPTLPSEAETTEGEGAASAQAAGTEAAGEQKNPADEAKTREHWQKRVEAAQKKITDLETQLNSPELAWGGGMRTDVNPLGQRNLSQRQELEGKLAQARAELDAIREEARRAGVPAGWVR